MNSPKIVCPKCRGIFNKPPDLEVMGDIKKSGASGVSFADPNAKLTCPQCTGPIRISDIIDGKHDLPKGGWFDTVVVVVILIVLFGAIVAFSSR